MSSSEANLGTSKYFAIEDVYNNNDKIIGTNDVIQLSSTSFENSLFSEKTYKKESITIRSKDADEKITKRKNW